VSHLRLVQPAPPEPRRRTSEGMLSIAIPVLPPSANSLFLNVARGRRVKTAAYREWLSDAEVGIRCAAREARWKAPAPKVPLHVAMVVHLDFRRDLDNVIKPTLDVLCRAGVIADDRWVHHIEAQRIPPPSGRTKQAREWKAEWDAQPPLIVEISGFPG